MDEFLIEMAEILEEDEVKLSDELDNFESWDSLAQLSVLAMADTKFGVKLSPQKLKVASTIEQIFELITNNKKD